jgi:monovalent cation/proton antiporter MnhG/PhaG subunit
MTLTIEVLVYAAVAIALLSSWFMLRMKDEYQMMHFMSPPASVSIILITLAIFLQQGRKPESFKALFITVVLLMMNSVVTHATARAFRIRERRDHWTPQDGERVPTKPSDEIIAPGTPEHN